MADERRWLTRVQVNELLSSFGLEASGEIILDACAFFDFSACTIISLPLSLFAPVSTPPTTRTT